MLDRGKLVVLREIDLVSSTKTSLRTSRMPSQKTQSCWRTPCCGQVGGQLFISYLTSPCCFQGPAVIYEQVPLNNLFAAFYGKNVFEKQFPQLLRRRHAMATHQVDKFPCKALPHGHGVGMFHQFIGPTHQKKHTVSYELIREV